MENSASCTAIPSMNRRFGIWIGLPRVSSPALIARGFGNILSREPITCLPDGLQPACQVSSPHLFGCARLPNAPGSRLLLVLTGYRRQPGGGAGRSRPDEALRLSAEEEGRPLPSVV